MKSVANCLKRSIKIEKSLGRLIFFFKKKQIIDIRNEIEDFTTELTGTKQEVVFLPFLFKIVWEFNQYIRYTQRKKKKK